MKKTIITCLLGFAAIAASIQAQAIVVVAAHPVVVAPHPVVVARPAPVVVRAAPVVARPAPVVVRPVIAPVIVPHAATAKKCDPKTDKDCKK